MKIRDLIIRNRTCRRFDQTASIQMVTLRELVDLARLSASSANLQPLKYVLSTDPATNEVIFEQLAWAGYLTDWPGPQEGERPVAYIIILGDRKIKFPIDCDHGIAAQSIMLGATERGYSGCIISAVKRRELARRLTIPEHLEIMLVLALGKCAEKVVLEEADEKGDIRYWRDEQDVHHVPKRKLTEIIIKEYAQSE